MVQRRPIPGVNSQSVFRNQNTEQFGVSPIGGHDQGKIMLGAGIDASGDEALDEAGIALTAGVEEFLELIHVPPVWHRFAATPFT